MKLCTRTISLFLSFVAGSSSSEACDELASRLIFNTFAPAIAGLKCEGLDQAGLDNAEHRLTRVCYTSQGSTSTLEVVADLRCKTSDRAFIRASISETITAVANVRGADCKLLDISVDARRDVGDILVKAFKVEGLARRQLQEALDDICK